MEQNSYLLKHTAAVHVPNILTLTQRKLVNVLLKHAFHELDKDASHKVPLSYVMRHLGWSENSEVTKLLRKSLKDLNIKQIEWNIFNKDRKQVWGVTTLLAYVQISNGIIEYAYSKPLRELLYRPNIYARLNLMVQRSFSNKHALALWEYALEYLSASKSFQAETDAISIEELKKFLGIQKHKTYSSFSALNAQVIVPALKEINEKSDIHVGVKFIKSGKKVSSLLFTVHKKRPKEQINLDEGDFFPIHKGAEAVINEAISLGISQNLINKHLSEFGEERVKSSIKLIKNDLNEGIKIKSIPAYYVACIKNAWEKPSPPITKTQDERKRLLTAIKEGSFAEEKMLLMKELGATTYFSWFRGVQFEIVINYKLLVRSPTYFIADYINTNFKSALLKAWQGSGKNIQYVEVVTCPQENSDSKDLVTI